MLQKILVVDDSMLIHRMYELVLEKYKCQILHATNGEHALEILEAQEGVQCILLDIKMPVMNGEQFLKKATELRLIKNIPVIVISTEGMEADTIRCLSLGAKAFLKKPFALPDFHTLLNNLIKPPRSNAVSPSPPFNSPPGT